MIVVNVRPQQRTDRQRGRLHVLLTEDRPPAPEEWIAQLPRLLGPQGVVSYVARTGREAIDLAERERIDAAVIDMGTPFGSDPSLATPRPDAAAEPAGRWLLELFRRLPDRPPVVLVHSPAFSRSSIDRLLQDALQMGVFSVLNKPLQLEQLLTVFQRLLDRRYRGAWPAPPMDRLDATDDGAPDDPRRASPNRPNVRWRDESDQT